MAKKKAELELAQCALREERDALALRLDLYAQALVLIVRALKQAQTLAEGEAAPALALDQVERYDAAIEAALGLIEGVGAVTLTSPAEPPIGFPPGFPVTPGQEQADITAETHALLVGLIARWTGGDWGAATFLTDAQGLLEGFYADLEQFAVRCWYPEAQRTPGWTESSDYYRCLIDVYIQLARAVCQARLLADIGHLQEWEYLRRVAVRDGYSLCAAIEVACILLQGEDRRYKEWYEQGVAYLNISIDPDERERRAVCHLFGLTYTAPDPHDGTRWGTWARSADAPSSPRAGADGDQ